MRHEGRTPPITEAQKRKTGEGEGIGSLSNNLVYTKRQKDIYTNRKHETTKSKKKVQKDGQAAGKRKDKKGGKLK